MNKVIKKCPICSHKLGSYAINVDTFRIYKCGECGLESTFPTPSAKQISQFYDNYIDRRADHEVVQKNSKKFIDLLRKFGLTQDMSVLDFGAGTGVFSDVYGELCINYDPFINKEKNITDFAQLKGHSFDAITMWSVLDNQPHPVDLLNQLTKILAQSGLLSFTVVSNENEIPYRYKPPEHLTYWTKTAIKKILTKVDLQLLYLEENSIAQRSDIYLELICSRIPKKYHDEFYKLTDNLPQFVSIPTNELFCIAKKI